MFKNLLVSACLILSLSTVSQARIIHCIDEKGRSYFTDTACPRQKIQRPILENEHAGTGVSAMIVNKPANPGNLEFYCNPGNGKFIRCE